MDRNAAFARIRAATEKLAAPLSEEDCVAQSMPDASPVKWHLGHTTWFFETFVLAAADPGHRPSDPESGFLFNSYYEHVGPRVARELRGMLTRPGLARVLAWRREVDARILEALASGRLDGPALGALELGLHHEQQHQELLLTDVKHLLSLHPFAPCYRPPAAAPAPTGEPAPLAFHAHDGGLVEIGHGGPGFAFDNEGPRHRVFLEPFELASRPVTCGEYLRFMEAGGYQEPLLWLSDGWDHVRRHGWSAPLYWTRRDGAWWIFTLRGLRPIDPDEPLAHVSHYEADAFARFAGARLPTEAEWEHAAACSPATARAEATFAEDERFHPRPVAPHPGARLLAMLGEVWEWTSSAYGPYPGFRPAPGALGEYNGKFMSGQMVLRGGSCATPRDHIRATYRNFFPAHARWQLSGLRLARDPSRS